MLVGSDYWTKDYTTPIGAFRVVHAGWSLYYIEMWIGTRWAIQTHKWTKRGAIGYAKWRVKERKKVPVVVWQEDAQPAADSST